MKDQDLTNAFIAAASLYTFPSITLPGFYLEISPTFVSN